MHPQSFCLRNLDDDCVLREQRFIRIRNDRYMFSDRAHDPDRFQLSGESRRIFVGNDERSDVIRILDEIVDVAPAFGIVVCRESAESFYHLGRTEECRRIVRTVSDEVHVVDRIQTTKQTSQKACFDSLSMASSS